MRHRVVVLGVKAVVDVGVEESVDVEAGVGNKVDGNEVDVDVVLSVGVDVVVDVAMERVVGVGKEAHGGQTT